MIVALLLAAGSARRFGSQKLLATLPDGQRVLEATARNLLDAGVKVIAVTRRDPALIDLLTARGCEVVINEQADEGMGSSIAAGVRASDYASGWLIALGDMPGIQPHTIAGVCEALALGAGIVIPCNNGQRGHPVGFSMQFSVELRELHGDSGARSLVLAHPDRVTLLAVEDAGILVDIDTPADLALLNHQR